MWQIGCNFDVVLRILSFAIDGGAIAAYIFEEIEMMLDPLTLREAAERASAGSGHPHKIVKLQRRADERAWIVSFNDAFDPEEDGAFNVVVEDSETPDEAAQAMLEAMLAP